MGSFRFILSVFVLNRGPLSRNYINNSAQNILSFGQLLHIQSMSMKRLTYRERMENPPNYTILSTFLSSNLIARIEACRVPLSRQFDYDQSFSMRPRKLSVVMLGVSSDSCGRARSTCWPRHDYMSRDQTGSYHVCCLDASVISQAAGWAAAGLGGG